MQGGKLLSIFKIIRTKKGNNTLLTHRINRKYLINPIIFYFFYDADFKTD